MVPTLTQKEFELFRGLIYSESGIALNPSKKLLVQSRLQKRIREKGLNSFTDYYELVTTDLSRAELVHMIDCISTNETYFFRESSHFDLLENQILPGLIKAKKGVKGAKIRLWSAACSSGEEPYTMAIVLFNQLEIHGYVDAKILATDISTKVIHKAIKGVYSKERIRNVPPQLVKRFFTPVYDDCQELYKIKDSVKELVIIRKFNLLDMNTTHNNKFDVIFCRNVMIYFDSQTRHELTKKYYELLAPGGYLFLSHSETLSAKDVGFRFVEPAVYQK